MVGWHHQINKDEFEQTLGDGEGQGSLGCCSSWGHKESDTTQQPNNNNKASEKAFSSFLIEKKWAKEKPQAVCPGKDLPVIEST